MIEALDHAKHKGPAIIATLKPKRLDFEETFQPSDENS